MATADEAAFAKTPLGADLQAGVEALSEQQAVVFTQYIRLVLPLDGYAFWVKSGLLTPSALFNVGRYNAIRYNQPPAAITVANTLTVSGSLHYVTELRQEQEEFYGANRVIFTAEQEVNDLNNIAPNMLWIGRITGGYMGNRPFAFSSQTSRYFQAGLWHYVGFAVYPDMEPQIIDTLAGFDRFNVIVSNSLPAWLALNSYAPFYGFTNPVTLFPSYLSPQNEAPPFGVVHIAPEGTRALGAAPRISNRTSSHSQLCADTGRVTLWGTRNFSALDFVDAVYQYSADTAAFGIMNMPVIRDEKRTQVEIGTIAQKKSFDFEVSYNQQRINQIARQLIESAIIDFEFSDA